MMKKIVIFLIVFSGFSVQNLFAASPSTSGAILFKQGMSARALGMGEAFTASADDINAINYNVAGLALLEKKQIGFTYLKGLEDSNWGYVCFAMPLNFGTIGISCFTLQAGMIDVYDSSGTNISTINAQSDYAPVFSYAAKINDNFSLGLNIKGLFSTLGQDYSASTVAGDLGLLMIPNEKVKLGFTVQNFGSEIKYISVADPLPLNIKAGIAWEFFKRFKIDNIAFCFDANLPNDNDVKYNVGMEYKNEEMGAAVRIGYKFGDLLGSYLDTYSAGFGLTDGKFHIDYAFILKGELGINHQVSFAVSF